MEGPIQIALVDDHRLFRSGMAYLINNFHRYSVLFEAGDGEEMIRKINSKLKPHVVLLDINMPKMDGLTFLRSLRRESLPLAATPAIVISTESSPKDIAAARAAGANFYLVKPVAQDTLIRYVGMLCGLPG